MAGAGDRHDIRRARQHPGERQLRRCAVLGRGMGLQLLDQRQITAQIMALQSRHIAARVAGAQRRNIGDVAGQDPRPSGLYDRRGAAY